MMMKHIIFLPVFMFSVTITGQGHNTLLPQPQEIRYGSGKLPLAELTIYLPPKASEEDRFNASQLSDYLGRRTGIVLPVVNVRQGRQVVIEHGDMPALPGLDEKKGQESRESYRLTISKDGIHIKAGSSAGAFYAIQTIRQMPECDGKNCFLPEAEISDWPELPYRGLLVAYAEGAVFNEQFTKEIIDELARFKSNQFMFYSESSIELDSFPLVGYKSKVKKETIRRLIQYARERHVDIIPFQALYGHLHDIFRTERYSSLSTVPYGFEFDPTNPQAREMVKKMIKEISDLFPSPFFHVGFDETWFTRRLARMERSSTRTSIF